MISYWGVDHGSEVSKKLSDENTRRLGAAGVGAGIAGTLIALGYPRQTLSGIGRSLTRAGSTFNKASTTRSGEDILTMAGASALIGGGVHQYNRNYRKG